MNAMLYSTTKNWTIGQVTRVIEYRGVKIERIYEGSAYGRNGNAHNPTAYFHYIGRGDGFYCREQRLSELKKQIDARAQQ